eukprot:2423569-Pleurochrysis_carterae.AAC.1
MYAGAYLCGRVRIVVSREVASAAVRPFGIQVPSLEPWTPPMRKRKQGYWLDLVSDKFLLYVNVRHYHLPKPAVHGRAKPCSQKRVAVRGQTTR